MARDWAPIWLAFVCMSIKPPTIYQLSPGHGFGTVLAASSPILEDQSVVRVSRRCALEDRHGFIFAEAATRWPPPAQHSEVRRGGGGRQDGDGGLGATVAQRPILLTVQGAGGRRGAPRPR